MKKVVLIFSIIITSMIGLTQEKSAIKNVIFIHGAWSTGNIWKNYKTHFSEEGFNTYSPTLSYHNTNDKDSLVGQSIEDYVNQIRKIVCSFETRPIVVAHSMGCIIAQRLAMEGILDRIILIAPPANYGMMPPSESIASVKWVNKVPNLKTSLAKPTFEQAVEGMLHQLPKEKQIEVYNSMTDESGLVMKEMIWIKNVFGKKPNKINYSKVNIPILFVAGGLDNASPVLISEKLKKKYKANAELKIVKNNAHWMMEEENWKEISTTIINWIN